MEKISHRIRGLDSIRFVAALVVALEHAAPPPLTAGFDPASLAARMMNGLVCGSFSGPAAVIVFFVISGFCIHYPYYAGEFNWKEFYTRRLLRISLPLAAALLLVRLVGYVHRGQGWMDGVPAWSLVAEMSYYILYPALRYLRKHCTWMQLFQIAFAAAFLLSFTRPMDNVDYPAWGNAGNCLIGLPCWMLGVLLAERVGNAGPVVPTGKSPKIRLWFFRGAIVMMGVLTHNLALQRVIGQHLTLNFYALAVYPWLAAEIGYYRHHPPPKLLEWAGRWSYSLYLVHLVAAYLVNQLGLPNFGYVASWLVNLFIVLALSYGFYCLVELPSHLVARAAGRNFRKSASG